MESAKTNHNGHTVEQLVEPLAATLERELPRGVRYIVLLVEHEHDAQGCHDLSTYMSNLPPDHAATILEEQAKVVQAIAQNRSASVPGLTVLANGPKAPGGGMLS